MIFLKKQVKTELIIEDSIEIIIELNKEIKMINRLIEILNNMVIEIIIDKIK
mgnify:CR=1 FL=1